MKQRLAKLLPPLPFVFPCILSGVLASLSFPNVSMWPLIFVAFVPIFATVMRDRPSPRDSFKIGHMFGFVYFVSLLWWIVALVPSADIKIPGVMSPALILIGLYLGLFSGLFMWLMSRFAQFRVGAMLLGAPALWVLIEVVRSSGELAFPWGNVGYALVESPPMIQITSITGLFGLTWLVLMINVLLASVVVLRMRARVISVTAAVVLVFAVWWYGHTSISNWNDVQRPTVSVAIVQPDIDLAIKWKPEFKDSTLRLIERLSREAASTGAEFVIFPETSAPVYIENDSRYKNTLVNLATELQVAIYIGFLDHRYNGPDDALNIFNSSGVFDPSGQLEKYDKRHLLPFGEALPLSTKFRWLRKIDFGQANFHPGPDRGPLHAATMSFTPLICFESVFADQCRDGVRQGTELFINITNDGWFGDTPGPIQHAQMSVLRAVEYRRFLLRSANTGVSMVVTPTGEISEYIGLYQPGIIVADVAPINVRTIYSRYGDWPVIIMSLLLAGTALMMSRRQQRTSV